MAEAKQVDTSNGGFDPAEVFELKASKIMSVVNRTDLMTTDRIVFMALVMDADPIDKGVLASILTIPEIHEHTGVSPRTVVTCVKRLEAHGLIARMRRKTTRYGNGLTYIIR